MDFKQSLIPVFHRGSNLVKRKRTDIKFQLAISFKKDHIKWQCNYVFHKFCTLSDYSNNSAGNNRFVFTFVEIMSTRILEFSY